MVQEPKLRRILFYDVFSLPLLLHCAVLYIKKTAASTNCRDDRRSAIHRAIEQNKRKKNENLIFFLCARCCLYVCMQFASVIEGTEERERDRRKEVILS